MAQPQTYGWNEMIFVTRDDAARLHILDTLPGEYYTEARQALYRPSGRIRSAFISERVRETFPPLAGPDWSGHQQYLRNGP